MMAYVTLVPCGSIEVSRPKNRRPSYAWVNGYNLRIVATHAPDKYPLDKVLELHMTRSEARGFAKAHGLELRLPSIGVIQCSTAEKSPHFFSYRSRRFHDKKGAHRLKVCRDDSGDIHVTNGRSSWRWTGDNLRYSH